MRYTFGKDELDLHGAAGGWLPSGKVGFRSTRTETTSGEITEKFFIRNIIGADEITSGWNLILNTFFNITRVCIFYINVNYRCRKIGRVILKINWNIHHYLRHFKIWLNLIKIGKETITSKIEWFLVEKRLLEAPLETLLLQTFLHLSMYNFRFPRKKWFSILNARIRIKKTLNRCNSKR